MSKIMRASYAVVVLAGALLLAGCFVSKLLLKEQRLWDESWQGRYHEKDIDYVVLAADHERRTYLVAQVSKSEFKAFRAAIYPGWDDFIIFGTQPADAGGTYQVVRKVAKDRVEIASPACAVARRKGEPPSGETCYFTSVDAMRAKMRANYERDLAQKKKEKEGRFLDRVNTKISTINVATEIGTFEDGDGIHGVLRVTQQNGLPASLVAGDQIVAVNGEYAASAGELLLRIAFEEPGVKVRLTLLDQTTTAEREVELTTSALK